MKALVIALAGLSAVGAYDGVRTRSNALAPVVVVRSSPSPSPTPTAIPSDPRPALQVRG